jgi:hypothetical protein
VGDVHVEGKKVLFQMIKVNYLMSQTSLIHQASNAKCLSGLELPTAKQPMANPFTIWLRYFQFGYFPFN